MLAGGERAGPMAITVLIVDDVADIRLLLRMAIDRHGGFEVVGEASDGVEAIDLARDHQPDLILLDIAMPNMDGLQTIPRVYEVSADSRILVLSAFASDVMADQAISLCAMGFIEKGRSPKEIMRALETVYAAPSKEECRQL
jgi:YesN/AraC family two-component response regulator